MTPRNRRDLTDEDLIKIASARFSKYPFKTIGKVAKQFNRNPAVISRAIKRAFKEGLVRFTVAERPEKQPRRVESLEKELLNTYHQLSTCIVIDEEVTSNSTEEDDALHAKLGKAMAAVIATGLLFHDGDIIGLGSGRGVYYTIENLARFPPLRTNDVTIKSLTGALYPRDHSEKVNLLMDADMHVGLLGLSFARKVNLSSLSHAIVFPNKGRLADVLHRDIGDTGHKEEIATHALVGVGVLSKGHRFFKEAKTVQENREHRLDAIYEFLVPLVEICEAEESKSGGVYCPVGDICNRLFYVPPPKGMSIGPHTQQNIKNLIEKINEMLFTITEEQLAQIDTVMLIAGTKIKAPAIRQLLESQYKIRFLCTDRGTAKEIIKQSQ